MENVEERPTHSSITFPSVTMPSVTKGSISIDKIKEFFNFKPTPIKDAFKQSIQFYNDAYKMFPMHRKYIEKDFKKEVLKKNEKELAIFDDFIQNFENKVQKTE